MNRNILNIEIKAKCNDIARIREILLSKNARFEGLDMQIDIYYKVNKGRLKLRTGNIENKLIYYQRKNEIEKKESNIILYKHNSDSSLIEILNNSLDELITVVKNREIFFIDNVKFHIDNVEHLGNFIEIECIDENGEISIEKLNQQCDFYIDLFQIKKEDFVSESYSDLLLKLRKT